MNICMMRLRPYVLLIILSGVALSCVARPHVRKNDGERHRVQNRLIIQNIREKARTGDWLVIRGYHLTDDLVVNATGMELSHAGIYNARLEQVIEAEGRGVHLTSLEKFVDKSHRLLIIRPRWQTAANGPAAWRSALEKVGKKYDYPGLAGLNGADRFYCSELAVDIYRPWFSGTEKFPAVIKPAGLYLYGTVLYDSLPRDELKIH
ncbi:MAG: hypothetical protein D6677_12980 [Calditrichaeota bacterium]|nr:MAG: hypothetical protein D6677_12980 [Calditrichota bacterium]